MLARRCAGVQSYNRRMRTALLVMLLVTPSLAATEVRVPVTRDTWVSSEASEREGNNGGDFRIKTKGIQELSLLDIDPAPLRGRVITAAKLHLHVLGGDVQRRLTVSSVTTEWGEGAARGYTPEKGAACWSWA